MKWINFFDEIYVINLLKRTDRLLQITKDFEELEIPFTRVSAVEDNENGARGLRDTMFSLFQSAIAKDQKNILVFEDDAKAVTEPFWVHDTMQKIISQLPENYHLCFLGGQPTYKFSHFYSPNLLPVTMYFSTHAVIYSLQAMKEIMARKMEYPIDNWYVKEIQVMGNCYACHPLLFGQRVGYSDINKREQDWRPFIEMRHEQKIAEMNGRQ